MVYKRFAKWFNFLTNPSTSYKRVIKGTLEEFLGDYMKMLLMVGVLGGLAVVIWQFIYAGYLSVFKGVSINFLRLANYYSGIAVGTFFFWLFAGTVIMFLAVIIIRIFIHEKIAQGVMRLCFSLAPVFVFGWINIRLVPALIIWTIVIYVSTFRK